MESLIWRRAALSSSKHPWLWNQRSTSTKHLQQLLPLDAFSTVEFHF
ncbi:hypothetical protein V6Z11_A13G067400 [Gossypium hirsutum]